MAKYCCWILLVGLACFPVVATAAPPSEDLLPDTTKGFLSVPDVELLRTQWNATQLGQMIHDPVMKPFVEDLQEQIKSKLSTNRIRLGITLEDLADLYGGELATAVIQPGNDPEAHANVVLVDITGHEAQAQALVEKVTKNLLAQGAKKKAATLDGVAAVIFEMPKKRPDNPLVEAVYVLHKNRLVVTDHRDVCQDIVTRLNGKGKNPLAALPAFTATLQRCAQDSGDMQPHVRWFVEPIGYAQVARAEAGGRKKRGVDLLKVLPNQGFDAILGVGGYVFFATGDQEILHRTMVYAPAVPRKADSANQDRYSKAARMLDFPNVDDLQPQPFVSRDLGTYATVSWKMIEAFEYSKTLVNELLGGKPEDDLLEDIITSLAKDADGPQVDLRNDLVKHFGQRLSIVADTRRPITPDSERLLFAVELTNPEAVQETINKLFDGDPEAQKREIDGQVIWEIITDEASEEVEEIQIEGAGFDPFEEEDNAAGAAQGDRKILPNSAITVLHGHLIAASHVDFIVDMLKRPLGSDVLSDAADYQLVEDALVKLGAGSNSFRFFTRTDEAYRATYELIRQGRMPEAKSVFGKILNEMLGPDEKGILREQQIDGSKMPEFDAVRRYLGPAGVYVHSEDNGWYVAGCLLSKDVEQAAAMR